MAATINDRDLFIMAGTRTQPVVLPSDVGVSGDVTGTLNGVPVQNVIDAANSGGDNTIGILQDSGTMITVNSSTLFAMPGSGSGGTFIGGGGIFGRNAEGVTKVSINSSTGLLIAEDALIQGTLIAGSVIAAGASISGTTASTVVGNASDGFTAFQDTVHFRVPGAPSNSPLIGSINISAAAVGSVDITLNWNYTQGAIRADHFILYYNEGTTNPNTSSPVLAEVDGDARSYRVAGVPMDKSYRVGIVAARKSAFGVQKTIIFNSWARNAASPVLTAALDYSFVTGIKPDANATRNFFTTSTSDPSGGVDGDAHFNSSTNVMWFRIGGTWRRGGTISASEITTGTLAAARIAASSITSDKINVTSLSAITANLGTVNAGSITGGAGIDITGVARFNGLDSGYCLRANSLGLDRGGIQTHTASSTGLPAIRAQTSHSAANAGLFVSNLTSGTCVQITAAVGATALAVSGPASFSSNLTVSGTTTISGMTKIGTGEVANLNAQLHGGRLVTAMCFLFATQSGTATASGGGFDFASQVSGTSTTGSGNQVRIVSVSDERLKQKIEPEILGLDFIRKLKPVSYYYKDKQRDHIKYHGFIYQDVRSDLAELLYEDDSLCRVLDNGMGSVDYMSLIAPIVKAIQQIDKRMQRLETI